MDAKVITANNKSRRHFIGGSDARIIMGANEDALIRLWREKRGEVEPEDLSANLVVQSEWPPKPSIGLGTSAIRDGPSRISSGGSATP